LSELTFDVWHVVRRGFQPSETATLKHSRTSVSVSRKVRHSELPVSGSCALVAVYCNTAFCLLSSREAAGGVFQGSDSRYRAALTGRLVASTRTCTLSAVRHRNIEMQQNTQHCCSGDTSGHRVRGVRIRVALVVECSILGVEHAVKGEHTSSFARRQPQESCKCLWTVRLLVWVLDALSSPARTFADCHNGKRDPTKTQVLCAQFALASQI